MKKVGLLLILFSSLFLILLLSSAFAIAKDYYVSSGTGSDTGNNGNITLPWKTLGKAVNMINSGNIIAGDTIHLQKGNVFNTGGLSIFRGGNSSGFITIRGDDYGNGNKPILRATSTGDADFIIHIKNGSYITLRDFVVENQGVTKNGIGIGDDTGGQTAPISNINVLNLTIQNLCNGCGAGYLSGVHVNPGGGFAVSNCLIAGNDISDYTAMGLNQYSGTKAVGNVAYNNTWRNNYIHNPAIFRYASAHDGIQICAGGANNVFEYNLIEDPTAGNGISVQGCSGNEENLILRYNILKDNNAGWGIWISRHDNSLPGYLKIEVNIYGNIISNYANSGIDVEGYNNDANTMPTETFVNIYNNILYNNDHRSSIPSTYQPGGEIYIHSYHHKVVDIRNNIIYSTTNNPDLGIKSGSYPGTVTTSNNLYWHSGGTGIAVNNKDTLYAVANVKTFEPTAQNSSPLFIDLINFKPASNSPAVDHGVALLSQYNRDILRNLRPYGSGWDIGAYEYVVSGPINATCGISNNQCNTGILNDIVDNSTHYLWKCLGISGGINISCSFEILSSFPKIQNNSILNITEFGVIEFNIISSGNYTLVGNVSAVEEGTNSFYIDLDNVPGNDNFTWDIPITNGYAFRTVSQRGALGNYSWSQFNPKIWNLNLGVHTLYIYEREVGTSIQSLKFVKNVALQDIMPPASVLNLKALAFGSTWIYWNWTSPSIDFNSSVIYLNGIWKTNTSKNYYNATELDCNTVYTLTINTKDHVGNINYTNITSTVFTLVTNLTNCPVIGCRDFDDYLDFNNTLFQASYTAFENILYSDTCENENQTREYYCGINPFRWDFWNMFKDKVAKGKVVACEYGCFNGACLNQTIFPAINGTELPQEPIRPGLL